MRLLALILVLTGSLASQKQGPPPLRNAPKAPQPDGPVLYDRVVGIVGDEVILENALRDRMRARLEGAEDGKPLTRTDIRILRRERLTDIYRNLVLAQTARTLQETSRQQVDAMVESELQRRREDDIRSAGGINKLSEQFQILGMSLDTLEDERRNQLLGAFAMQRALQRRVRDQFALLVTPREMRDFYKTNIADYVSDASSDVAIFIVTTSEDDAAAAAEAWKAPDMTPEKLEKQFGGRARPTKTGVSANGQDAQFIREFAARAKLGEVSSPVRLNGWWVLKLVARREESRREFRDPAVQREIQRRLIDLKEFQIRARVIDRGRRGFNAWIPELDGR